MKNTNKILGLSLFAILAVQSVSANSIENVMKELETLKQKVSMIEKKDDALSGFQLSGYASFTYEDKEKEDGKFSQVKFAPIFHYLYSDKIQFEAELEIGVEEDGKSEFGLEYAAANVFLNDYTTLIVGKFLSPLGNFVQNIHPNWINKLATAPSGFGHDGAAPTSFVGLGLRGVVPIDAARINYSMFIANGPTLSLDVDRTSGVATALEVHGIAAEGRTGVDGSGKTIGTRISLIPMANSEIGVSFGTGKANVVYKADTNNDNDSIVENERDYSVFGVDATFNFGNLDLKAEYIEQVIGKASGASLVTEQGELKWSAWYTQASYVIPDTKYELALRYGISEAPEAKYENKQTSLGINYNIASNVVTKFNYESNDYKDDTKDYNKYTMQLAFGF